MSYIVFDIGGTKTRVGYSENLSALDKIVSFKTTSDFKKTMKLLVDAAEKMTNKKPLAIAGGVRGRLNEEKTGLDNDLVLATWRGKSIAAELQRYANVPVFLENDSAMAGLGEAVFGAGKGLDIIAYHTVSTGVGGVKVENGQIDLASVGFEPGHQILDIDRTVLGDDIVPTLENLVSGTALAERFGVPAYDIPQDDVVWDELAEYLAQGLRNTVMYWSPEAIILGGSMILGDPAINIDSIRKYTVESIDGFVDSPLITKATLGDEAGLYGGLVTIKHNLAED